MGTARQIPVQVERRGRNPKSRSRLRNRVAHFECVRELVASDLDASECPRARRPSKTMPANAHLAQADRAKLRLEATDLREPLSRHLAAEGAPARQARARHLVPD